MFPPPAKSDDLTRELIALWDKLDAADRAAVLAFARKLNP